jgi:uncharacterized protein DUF11
VQSRTALFLVAAFVVGTIVSQASFAFADDEANPFKALWDSIDSINNKTDSLQAQIDDLKAQKDITASSQNQGVEEDSSNVNVSILSREAEESDGVHIDYIVKNDGPSDAVGVKLTAFYKMSAIHIQYISSSACVDMSRGIMECHLGTIKSGGESVVTVIATDMNDQSSERPVTLTADVSSINDDLDYTNNHEVLTLDTNPATNPRQMERHEEENKLEQDEQQRVVDSNQTLAEKANETGTYSSNEGVASEQQEEQQQQQEEQQQQQEEQQQQQEEQQQQQEEQPPEDSSADEQESAQ